MIGDSERSGQYEEALRVMLRGWQAGIWTAMQGAIVSFDPDKQTASVQIGTQIQVTDPDGTKTWVDMPLLVDCPVFFARGGGSFLSFPVTKDDECLVVFANRCIDPWYQQGGIQPQSEFRMHDLSDGFVFVGFGSMPNVLTDFSPSYILFRGLAGINVQAPSLSTTGNVTVGTGASGSFTTTVGQVVTVRNGIITAIGS